MTNINMYKKTLGALAISSSLLLAVSACAPTTPTTTQAPVQQKVAQQVPNNAPGVKLTIGSNAVDKISAYDVMRTTNGGLRGVNFSVKNLTDQPLILVYSTTWKSETGQPVGNETSSFIDILDNEERDVYVTPDNPQGYQAQIRLTTKSAYRDSLELTPDDLNAMASSIVTQFLAKNSNRDLKNARVFLGKVRNNTSDSNLQLDDMNRVVKDRLSNTGYFHFTNHMDDATFKLGLELNGRTRNDGTEADYNVRFILHNVNGDQSAFNSLFTFYKKQPVTDTSVSSGN